MKKELDFLKAYEKKVEIRGDIFKIFGKRLFIILVSIYCPLAGGIFFYWSILKKEYKQIITQIEIKKTKIKQQEKKESLYFLLKNQLSSLSKILSSNEENRFQVFSFLTQLSGGEVEISEIKVFSNGEIKISGVAPDAFSFARFLNEITGSESISPFSRIILDSLSRQKEGVYLSLIHI